MKFMLMMHAPMGTGDYAVSGWSPAARRRHVQFMGDLNKDLQARGELVGAEGLAPPGETKVVRAGLHGEPEVTGGPFPESKEFLVGFWLVDVENEARAYAIAARASAAPGSTGEPLRLTIDVRRVMGAPIEG